MLDAAASSIAEKGFAATSVEDIVGQAGYSRGAFYSNFSSKSDLFVELLRLDHQNMQKNLQTLRDAAPSSENLQEQFTLLYAQCYRDDNNYIVWAEARLHAMRDATFRQHVHALCLQKRDMVAYFIEQLCKRLNIQLPGPFADHALAVIALIDGILCFNMTMPNDLSDASAEATLCHVFTRMFCNASVLTRT
ncbi:TetR/AcrR family transcriptional regulator [Paraburkholderia fynbosensis]|uniref:TetR/AcrR family transcriptional regulator n=1 Tax=Paraburkholderia fynbosensis TaxID=1200993 RepID=UPI001FE403A9|nr:TetR/AcrR family transcriptional regulator [Paraburkholderia fynbosensis]